MDGALKKALERDFGSIDSACCLFLLPATVLKCTGIADFKTKMNAVTAAIQGSGWGWLGYNPDTQKLEIVTTPNQDPLLSAS